MLAVVSQVQAGAVGAVGARSVQGDPQRVEGKGGLGLVSGPRVNQAVLVEGVGLDQVSAQTQGSCRAPESVSDLLSFTVYLLYYR